MSARPDRRTERPAHGGAARAGATAPVLDVRLYYALTADVGDRELAALPRADLERVPRAALAARRTQQLVGRALLRAALEDVTGRRAGELEIRTTPRGKPECVAGPSVSVSHSGPWAACAIAVEGSVGVDVQSAVPGRRVESIAREYFARAESDWIEADPERRFYMLWVLKEAYLKALGLGLAGGLGYAAMPSRAAGDRGRRGSISGDRLRCACTRSRRLSSVSRPWTAAAAKWSASVGIPTPRRAALAAGAASSSSRPRPREPTTMTTGSALPPAPTAGSSVSHTGPFAAFGLMALLWGYNWVVMKIAMQFSGPLDFAAWRGGLGVLLLFGVLLAMRVPLRPRHVAKTIWLGLFQTTGFVGLISWSLTTGAAGKSAVLAYTMPFWVILFGWPFLAERLRGWQWVAVGLALVGLVLVLEIWDSSASLTSSVLALAAGASWGVSVILFKRIPVNTRDELLSLTAWQMLYGCLPLIAAAWIVPERPIEWSGAFIAALSFQRRRRHGDRDAAVAIHSLYAARDDQQPELADRADRRRARRVDPARRAAEPSRRARG